jgi:hypothetical protein
MYTIDGENCPIGKVMSRRAKADSKPDRFETLNEVAVASHLFPMLARKERLVFFLVMHMDEL